MYLIIYHSVFEIWGFETLQTDIDNYIMQANEMSQQQPIKTVVLW